MKSWLSAINILCRALTYCHVALVSCWMVLYTYEIIMNILLAVAVIRKTGVHSSFSDTRWRDVLRLPHCNLWRVRWWSWSFHLHYVLHVQDNVYLVFSLKSGEIIGHYTHRQHYKIPVNHFRTKVSMKPSECSTQSV